MLWAMKDKAGAILLAVLAIGLGLIAADLLFGGKVLTTGCCDDDAQGPADAGD